jgi:hypothetical protein
MPTSMRKSDRTRADRLPDRTVDLMRAGPLPQQRHIAADKPLGRVR